MIYVPEFRYFFQCHVLFFPFFFFGETISEGFDNIVFDLDKRIFFGQSFWISKPHIIVF
jgi:hypothetical protein